MSQAEKPTIQWQVVYQKLYFTRLCCEMGEHAPSKAKAIALRHSAVLNLYASLNAFIDYMRTQVKSQRTHIFSIELLENWASLYAENGHVDFLAKQFDKPLWQMMWAEIESALSAKNRPLEKPAAYRQERDKGLNNDNAQNVSVSLVGVQQSGVAYLSAEDWQQILQWAEELEAFYDQCAPSLDEF